MNLLFLSLFLCVSCLNFIFEMKQNKKGRYTTKPLLMPLLIVFYLLSAKTPHVLIILALTFSFLGDVFLMVPKTEKTMFGGILSFLIGHVFYIFFFFTPVPFSFYLWILPYLIYELMMIKLLFPHLKSLKVPILIYMSVISFMSFSSLTKLNHVNTNPFIFTFTGSLLFILSDSILAYSLFKKSYRYSNTFVMLFYLLAQLFIVIGVVI